MKPLDNSVIIYKLVSIQEGLKSKKNILSTSKFNKTFLINNKVSNNLK